jgi:hypothetical protein
MKSVIGCFLALLSVLPPFHTSDAFSPTGPFITRPLFRTPALAARKPTFQEYMEDPYKVATLLLGTVLERRSQEVDYSFDALISRFTPSYKLLREEQQARIESLIESLRKFDNIYYDPTESLLGPFYCSLNWYTPNVADAVDPLWERVSLKVDNIKGQQYYESKEFKESVINYSEIWGPQFHIRAKGSFAPSSNAKAPPRRSFLDRLRPRRKVEDRMRSCPDVYQVNATGASLSIMGLTIELPIEGSSNLVVLYADPRIRVFVSPLESQSVVGNWEDAGLVVVQVRSDLVTGRDPTDLR